MFFTKKYIVTTAGGLGNQMMNYCLWYYLKYTKGFDAILYPKDYQLNDHNGYELNKVFPNTKKTHNSSKWIDFYVKSILIVEKIFNKIGKLLKTNKLNNINKEFPISVINFPCWNDYLFISEVRKEIVEEFTVVIDIKNNKLIRQLREQDSVSIHIRRGDYQNNIYWRKIVGDICGKEYYSNSIETVYKHIKTPIFYVFSDDIQWAKENLNLNDANYVTWNTNEDSYKDLILMSNCKANIIANSTFSLMAAWLNTREHSIKIVPTKWRNYYNDNTVEKYIPTNWFLVNNNIPFVCLIYEGKLNQREVNKIMKSSYSDFVLQIDNAIDFKNNNRIVDKYNSFSRHIIYLKHNDIIKFNHRNFLTKAIDDYLLKIQ